MDNTTPRLTELAHGGGCGCKVAPGVLAKLLRDRSPLPVPADLLVGIETSDDAAVWRVSPDQAIVATTDFFMPIVDEPFDFGRIAATNAISDVYAMGGRPIFALAVVGMPVNKLSAEVIAAILRGGEAACAAAGIPIAGGHTIDSLEPIYGLVVLGLVHPERVRRNRDGQAGDVLILGKPLGVGIYSSALKKGRLDADQLALMVDMTTRLNTPGPDLAEIDGVHALTDVTGFGLLGHGWEVARGSGLRAHIDRAAVPFLPGVRALASEGCITGASGRNWASYGEHVRGLEDPNDPDRPLLCDPQTSGGLLVSCAPSAVDAVLRTFTAHGFESAAVVGRLDEGPAEVVVSGRG